MIGNAIAGGKQLLAMGAGPFIAWGAVLALIAGIGIGVAGARIYFRGEIAERKTEIANLRSTYAQGTSQVLTAQVRIQNEILRELNERIDRAIEQLSGEQARAAELRELARIKSNTERLLEDDRYACRNLPLPDWYIDGLRFPAPATADPAGNGH